MLYRTILSYLLRKASPEVSIKPGQYPEDPRRDDGKYRNYTKFMEEHRVELRPEEKHALNSYRTMSSALNLYMRGLLRPQHGYDSQKDKMDKQIDLLDRAISRSVMKRPVTLWRGIGFFKGEPLTDKLLDMGVLSIDGDFNHSPTKAELDSFIGFKFKEKAFSSASLAPNLSWSGSDIILRILLDKGQSGLVTNSAYKFIKEEAEFSEGTSHQYSTEHEVLLNYDTVFVVESARFNKKGRYNSQMIFTVRVLD